MNKFKYHLKGIGGRPSKQMKEIQKQPLTFLYKKCECPIELKPGHTIPVKEVLSNGWICKTCGGRFIQC